MSGTEEIWVACLGLAVKFYELRPGASPEQIVDAARTFAEGRFAHAPSH